MKKSIYNYNSKGFVHGYAEEYDQSGLWCRTTYKNGKEIGYEEVNMDGKKTIGEEGTQVNYYIR